MSGTTIVEVFWKRISDTPDKAAIYRKTGGEYKPLTWKEYGETVKALCAALLQYGVDKTTNVGILADNCPEWSFCDLAILSSGGNTVPIYSTLAPDEVAYIVRHSEVDILFLEDSAQLEKVVGHETSPPETLRTIVVMDDSLVEHDTHLKIIGWSDFIKEGNQFLSKQADKVEQAIHAVEPDDLATIVYTSGTTGFPKGAMIKHRNIAAVLEAMKEVITFTGDDLALSFLPLSHVYERVGGQFMAIYNGLPFAYAESMEKVASNINEIKPTVLNAVPRFYEKAYQKIQTQIRAMPQTQQAFVRWALGIGLRATKQRIEKDVEIGVWEQFYRAEMRIADRLVFKKIRDRLGGRLRLMTSGAAPLSNDVHMFFEAIGLSIIEGYGLTETCAPLACNRPGQVRFNTVGRPLPGVDVRLAEDGELLVRGPTVFYGYYKNESATDAAFEDEWFRTGDIASIDEEGYITITDRKKDIIITAGGKHVAPQMIENMFKGDALVAQVVAYGDRRKYISALFAINRDGLRQFARRQNLKVDEDDAAELIKHPRVIEAIQQLVDEKNSSLANYQRIKKFVLLDRELSIEENELTPTMKVKRKVVTEKFKELLDSMYDREDLETQAR